MTRGKFSFPYGRAFRRQSEARPTASAVYRRLNYKEGKGLVAVDHNRGGSGHRPVHSIAETGGEASYHS